jgi:hypothetical protein
MFRQDISASLAIIHPTEPLDTGYITTGPVPVAGMTGRLQPKLPRQPQSASTDFTSVARRLRGYAITYSASQSSFHRHRAGRECAQREVGPFVAGQSAGHWHKAGGGEGSALVHVAGQSASHWRKASGECTQRWRMYENLSGPENFATDFGTVLQV